MATRPGCPRWWFLTLTCAAAWGAASSGEDALRQLHVGDPMPAFSLRGSHGAVFQYGPGPARVLALVVVQAGQTHLERLLTDVEGLARKLHAQARYLTVSPS